MTTEARAEKALMGPVADSYQDKGLKKGALGLISSTVIGVASTAPAYSLAATLGFVVVAIGLVTASLAQGAGQDGFLLFGANGIGQNPASWWVHLVGILWIVAMTFI